MILLLLSNYERLAQQNLYFFIITYLIDLCREGHLRQCYSQDESMCFPFVSRQKYRYIRQSSYLMTCIFTKTYLEHGVFVHLFVFHFKIHQVGQIELPNGPGLACGPYVWHPCSKHCCRPCTQIYWNTIP